MATLTADEVELLTPTVKAQCRKVAARYQGVDTDDLEQEVWVWMLSDAAPSFYDYIQRGEIGRATKSIYNAAVKWCERDRHRQLAAAGLDWRDEYNYTRPEVARLLPAALDTGQAPGMSGAALHDGPSAKSDPAVGGDLLAGVVDVRMAYAKLSEADQQFIQVVVGLNSEWEQIASTSGLKASSAYAKYMRILDRMVTRHLGRRTDEDEDE